MAAVRCMARKLGGSLLQRTQPEEGRRLVPSRLMRSRLLSSEASGENAFGPKIEEELRRLRSEVAKKKAALEEANKPTAFDLVVSVVRMIDGVIVGAAKLAFVCFIPYSIYYLNTEKGAQAQALAKREYQRKYR